MAQPNIALVLLAAGASSRFGGRKLECSLGGDMVGLVTARRLVALPFAARIAICNSADVRLAEGFKHLGFSIVANDDVTAGMSGSIALAAATAAKLEVDALLIVLADMPNISVSHIQAMIDIHRAGAGRVATICAGTISPPALFASADFAALGALSGQAGARAMLSRATLVEAEEWAVADIDTREDLARISRSYPPSTTLFPDPS